MGVHQQELRQAAKAICQIPPFAAFGSSYSTEA